MIVSLTGLPARVELGLLAEVLVVTTSLGHRILAVRFVGVYAGILLRRHDAG